MERPDIDCYKDEIHHPNGQIEDRWRHNEYVEDLEKYVDYLESQVSNVVLDAVIKCDCCEDEIKGVHFCAPCFEEEQ